MRFLCCVVMFGTLILSGCSTTATPNRVKAEAAMATYYEQAYKNEVARNEAQEKALRISSEKDINYKLDISIADRVEKSKADPVKYPAGDTSAEIARLHAKATEKKVNFAAAQSNFRTLQDQNAATNLAGARKIKNALIGTSAEGPVDQTASISGALGTPPEKAKLLDPFNQ